MATALRPIRHEDRLSLVEHLDELRTRLIISVVAFTVCFGVCIWQSDAILEVINRPLEKTAFRNKGSKDPFERTAAFQARLRETAVRSARVYDGFALAERNPELRRGYERLAAENRALARSVPPREARRPVTLGVGEPFTATLRVAGYAALLLCLPLLLYQVYAFVLPAFSKSEREVAVPLMVLVPFLFMAGVAFAYYLVLPNAINFLQNFNDDQFDILLQARDYYRFAVMVMMSMGLLFQIPVGILAITRAGIISVAQLRRNRRYAILVAAILAMLLPGTDPVTMLSAMLPLVVLFEGSILLASLLERRAARATAREEAEMAAAKNAELLPLDPDDD
ncbi:MAG: twin-arginine translocase subunit TatC [Actinomycetota bacterium]|nr:twin-arginine translocase subunit TatC [Actinomycetota bacterium]